MLKEFMLCAPIKKRGFEIYFLVYEILLFLGLFISLLLANRLVFALDFNEAPMWVGQIPRGGILFKKRSKFALYF